MARELCEEEKSRDIISSGGGGALFYSDVSSNSPAAVHQAHMMNQMHSFEGNPEIFNLTTGMEMIGFSSRNLQQHTTTDGNSVMWKGFFNNKPAGNNNPGPSSSKTINHHHHFYDQHDDDNHQFNTTGMSETSGGENLIVGPRDHDDGNHTSAGGGGGTWQENNSRLLVDDSSLRCVFPCEGNERPSQGLSLSLSSTNPSSIGLQSFELRQTNHNNHHHDNQQDDDMRFLGSSTSRDGTFVAAKAATSMQQQQQMMQDGFLGKAAATPNNIIHHQFQLRNSKYLAPAQELLYEFCSLGTKQQNDTSRKLKSHNNAKQQQWDDENPTSSSRNQSLYSLEFMELQKRKTKLLSMLEEVDRRYKHYCDQMKGVVSAFEGVAGNGAASVYSALASKAMSRHFRCLRDGIVGQIQATKKAMGEKDAVAPGTSRGETPRLKIIDQALRQQRAFQQMTLMESHPWRPQRGLPERSVSVLRAWLFEHFLHPYPSDVDKHILARQTGLSRSQVSNWFINARVRLWKPMVEEMYLEETKEQDSLQNHNMASSDGAAAAAPPGSTNDLLDDNVNDNNFMGRRPLMGINHDQKPTQDQLVRIDSECLSSIINNPDKHHDHDAAAVSTISSKAPNRAAAALHHHHHHHLQQQSFGSFGAGMELDFSSYNQHNAVAGGVSYGNDHDINHHHNHDQNFNGGGTGGVSLTLGLQQHGGNGVSLAFSPATQSSLFYPRSDHIEDCQPVPHHHQYSLLDGEAQNLPYRNLMGAQLLHDLAG